LTDGLFSRASGTFVGRYPPTRDVTVPVPHTHTNGLACPACGGLECLERPRFFAGQLLTEAELNSDQAYVLAKNRLHNRYLHGPGVVCGLQVVCDDCDGWVRVKPGYAIDPCGNDIIVCEEKQLNVRELIARCRDVGGTKVRCDPVRDDEFTRRDDCRGLEEHWCITIAYEEREARASTVLRSDTISTGSCRCANGNGHGKNGNGGCGCGCGGGRATSVSYDFVGSRSHSSKTMREAAPRTVGVCEPTRIVEGFRLDVCEDDPGPCRTPLEALEGTLLWDILNCFFKFVTFLQRRVPKKSFGPLIESIFSREISGDPQELFESYCYLRQALYELDANDPLKVRCDLKATLDRIVLQSPPANEDETYAGQAQAALQDLFAITWQYFLDCVCQQLLPPCPPDPADDRLVLACLTIVDGKITRICNFGCRRHSGAWPTLYRWSTLLPVLPLLGALVEYLCCTEWLDPRDKKRGNKVMAGINKADPTYRRQGLYESDFKELRDLAERVSHVRDNFTTSNLGTAISDPHGFAAIVRSAFRGEDR
jgi:hypothetical protein